MNNNCSFRCTCLTLAVIASAIVGVIATVLTITAAITVTPAFLWVVLGVAVVGLALLLVVTVFGDEAAKCCIARALPALLTGILGAILLSVVLLAITFAATSIVGALLVGALLLFASLIVTSTACVIRCLAVCCDD